MAPAYENVASGQVVVSGQPRPDLEALARWVSIPEPEVGEPDVVESLTLSGDPVELEAVLVEGTDSPAPLLGEADVAIPVESWTHEQIDAYAAERGVTFPTNTTKAAKLTHLKETA